MIETNRFDVSLYANIPIAIENFLYYWTAACSKLHIICLHFEIKTNKLCFRYWNVNKEVHPWLNLVSTTTWDFRLSTLHLNILIMVYIQVEAIMRTLKLSGHVGFDSLPDQLVNKSVQNGFVFNILCIGK